MTLGSTKNKITTNRGMIKRTFLKEGKSYAADLALKNCRDLLKILQWNEEHKIRFFRVSSNIFPWASEYDIRLLSNFTEIEKSLLEVGRFASLYGHRLTTHPGPFNKLCSNKERVVQNTIKDLEIHGLLFDLMGLSRTPYNKINIHVGATYGDKKATCETFVKNYYKLSESVRSRLTIENDDKASMYSVVDLYNMIHSKINNIPIVFDYHHHSFCTGGLTEAEALSLAANTWGNIKPVVHYSESKSLEEGNNKLKPQAHSYFITGPIKTYGLDVDIMIEAKGKELALLKYRKEK